MSTSGVYGDCAGARVRETRRPRADTSRAKRRVDAETQLTRAAKLHGVRLVILRVPGIYAADRLPLARLRAGTPALNADEDVYTNHIHAEDLARITGVALKRALKRSRPLVRVIHTSDDSAMKMGDYFDLVADAFKLPRPPRVSRADLANAVSPMLLSFMNESRRLDNTRMKKEFAVKLRYPTVKEGVAAAAEDASRGTNLARSSPD